ncbi:Nuclear aminoacylation-dependent tRNA export pathway component [Sorochytrium milnesiophthora]
MASLVSSLLKSTISRVVGVGKDLPSVAIGDRLGEHGIWTLYSGTKRDDGSAVTVFTFDVATRKDKLPLAANAFKRMRTIRHPEILRFIDGVQNDSTICFATEAIVPLTESLRDGKPDVQMALLGLYKIAQAISFLNKDCKMVHCNIRPASVFVTRSGEWKLGGLEVLSSMAEEPFAAGLYSDLLMDSYKYATPEVRRGGWRVVRETPVHATDAYQYACLAHEMINGPVSSFETYGFAQGLMSPELYRSLQSLLSANPKTRTDVESLLIAGRTGHKEGTFFNSELVPLSATLENIAIVDANERERLVRKINATVDGLPISYAKYKVLPALLHALEFAGAGPQTIVPVLKIGKNLSSEEYDSMVGAAIVKLFASPDRTIRLALLENLSLFVDNVSNKTVSDKIFPNLALGFSDAVPLVRDQTIKSVLLLAPKLSDRILNNDLLRHLGKCQTDEEAGIRTNTTVCLGRLAPTLSDATRKKVLVAAFSRSLRDPFPPARVAGLNAFHASAPYFSIEDIACRAVPSIAPLIIDPEKSVRTPALSAMQMFMQKLDAHAKAMPETAVVAGQADVVVGSSGGFGSASSLSGGNAGTGDNWAWGAMSSLTKNMASRLVGVDVDGAPPQQMPSPATAGSPGPSYGNYGQPSPVAATGSSNFGMTQSMSLPAPAPAPAPLSFAMPADEEGDGWDDFELPATTKAQFASSTTMAPTSMTLSKPVAEPSGWGNDDDDPWASFEDMDKTLPSSTSAPAAATAASSSGNLGGRFNFPVHAIRPTAAGGFSPSSSTPSTSTAAPAGSDPQSAMALKREEQRKRMAERREKRKTLGAVKI